MIDLQTKLSSLADEKYKQFHSKLTFTNYEILGVNVPKLRNIAKELAKEVELKDLLVYTPTKYEELTVLGLIINYKKCDIVEKLPYYDYFISLNDNWASNDIVAQSIKCKDENFFNYLMEMCGKGEWYTRFAVTSLLTNFIDNEHLMPIFDCIKCLKYGFYYVDMAVAWLLSIAYIKFKNETFAFLDKTLLPKFVLQKTISKICDSLRVSKEEKMQLREHFKERLCKKETL